MKLLVPHDGSAQSDKALEVAMQFIQGMGGSIVLVHVVPDLCLMTEELSEGDCDAVAHALDANARAAMRHALERLAEGGISVETVMRNGRIVDAILDVAGEKEVDCIVVGAHGRHKAVRMLLGSVSSKVAELATCNVFIVK